MTIFSKTLIRAFSKPSLDKPQNWTSSNVAGDSDIYGGLRATQVSS